jgi:hypothetical protein
MLMMQPILRGAKIMLFLLGFTALVFSLIVLFARPTHAESFLSKTTCGVVGLLGIHCSKPVAPEPAPPSQPTPPQPAPTPSENTSSNQASPTNSGSAATPEPISMEVQPITEIPAIPRDQPHYGSLPSSSGYLANAMVLSPAQKQVLGASSAPLQASGEGWRIYGVAWYWWVIALLGGAGLFMAGKLILARRG